MQRLLLTFCALTILAGTGCAAARRDKRIVLFSISAEAVRVTRQADGRLTPQALGLTRVRWASQRDLQRINKFNAIIKPWEGPWPPTHGPKPEPEPEPHG